jgi:hypothetical protein
MDDVRPSWELASRMPRGTAGETSNRATTAGPICTALIAEAQGWYSELLEGKGIYGGRVEC